MPEQRWRNPYRRLTEAVPPTTVGGENPVCNLAETFYYPTAAAGNGKEFETLQLKSEEKYLSW